MPIKILMPALSPTMTEGNLVRWVKKEGEEVASGDVLAEIETDKATMEVESVEVGKLARILVPEGTEGVKVNQVIALLLEENEDASSLNEAAALGTVESGEKGPSQQSASVEKGKAPLAQESAAPLPTPLSMIPASQDRILASPLAKRLASEKGIDLSKIQGSGPRGRIIKIDVEGARPGSKGATQPRQLGAYQEIPLSGMRKVIAQRLTEAKQTIPHFYLTISCEVDALLELRQQLNEALVGEGKKVSVNDMIVRACALALMKVPEANVTWAEGRVRQYNSADVCVAVAVEGGLVTPIIPQANQCSVVEISDITKDLIERARTGKLKPEEYQGGTFTLSNLGMYGVRDFSAIINPPQGCILAVGAAEQQPVVKNGEIRIATVMHCTLSVDHRVVDGAIGATFLQHFKRLITQPVFLVMS